MTKTTLLKGTLTALAAGLLCALPASAQSQSVGWGPWIGCWQAEGAPEDAALCVRTPAGQEGAVEIVRVEGSELLDREVLWADGQRHETVRDECTGWERGEFSRDGLRLFLSSSHTCEDGTVQEGGGIMTMAEPDEWLDIRYLEVAGEPSAWVQRYRPAPMSFWETAGLTELEPTRIGYVRAARNAAAEAPDVEDVIEASERLPAVAVEAWVAEKGDPFDLNADHLVAMADAGVADRVIDVVVAVSNPDVFVLANDGEPERAEREDRGYYDRGLYGRYRGRVGFGYYGGYGYRPYYYNPFYYGYGPGYYGGFGYYGGGYGYGYRPTVVIVDRVDDTPRPRGRVIAGRGYRNPGSSSAGGRVMRPSGPSGGSSAAPSSTRSGSGSSGRKAKPRPKGGGGF